MNGEAQRIVPAPILRTLRIRAPLQRTFDVFASGMGRWWLEGHSLLKSPQKDVVVEPREGGRWYEVGEDGSEQAWGKVLAWEPPHRLLLAWQLTADWTYDPDFETRIEIRFAADGEFTIVEFEHHDLERYGDRADAQRRSMDSGWGELLARYQRLAEAE